MFLHITVQRLSSRRAILTASLLSSPSSHTLLAHAKAVPKFAHTTTTLEKLITEQKQKDLENVYRMCAGVTTFEARDPDPNAVDNGRIIGIRFEVFDQREWNI
jgi:central kinetochore subunit Mal2/MCM21